MRLAIVGASCLFPAASGLDHVFELMEQGGLVSSRLKSNSFGRSVEEFLASQPGSTDTVADTRYGLIDPSPMADFAVDDRSIALTLLAIERALADHLHKSAGKRAPMPGLIWSQLLLPTSAVLRRQDRFTRAYLNWCVTGKVDDLPEAGPKDPAHAAVDAARERFHLQQPCYALDAACSSVLYAIDLAGFYLRHGGLREILVGGVSAADPLVLATGFNVLRATTTETSLPLDADSKGIILGEGAGCVLLKSVAHAREDGDHIYAVIEAVGTANDGKSGHLLKPAPEGQVRALARAYQKTRLQPDYVECHATGTPVGDATEIETLGRYFGERDLMVGANKAHTGHLLTASGMVGLVKLIKALERERIPPTRLNRSLRLANHRHRMATDSMPWHRHTKPRVAALNAFGFGGTNAHLVLSDACAEQISEVQPSYELEPLQLTGVACHVGDCDHVGQFSELLRSGGSLLKPPSADRLKGQEKFLKAAARPVLGAFVDELWIEPLRFKVSPNTVSPLFFEQLLMTQVADQACRAAGMVLGDSANQRTAVVVAKPVAGEMLNYGLRQRADTYLQLLKEAQIPADDAQVKEWLCGGINTDSAATAIGNMSASKLASVWDFRGPVFCISDSLQPVQHLLTIAHYLLSSREVDQVVLGVVDLNLDPDRILSGGRSGEGAAAIVVKRASDGASSGVAGKDLISSVEEHLGPDLTALTGDCGMLNPMLSLIASLPEGLRECGPPGQKGGLRLKRGHAALVAHAPPTAPLPMDAYHADMWSRLFVLNARHHLHYLQQVNRILRSTGTFPVETTGLAETAVSCGPIPWLSGDLVTRLAKGELSAVFGPQYGAIEARPYFARTPAPPFLFISRVRRTTAEPDRFEPCEIEWEYDIDAEDSFVVGDRVSPVVISESSHAIILALLYMRCDLHFTKPACYRALGGQIQFLRETPKVGETFVGHARITSLKVMEKLMLVDFAYDGYVNDQQIFSSTFNGCLVERTNDQPVPRLALRRKPVAPCDTAFLHIVQERWTVDELEAALHDYPPFRHRALQMVDEIRHLNAHQGEWGNGIIETQKRVPPDHWIYEAHFPNDPVFPGTLLVEGAIQSLQIFMLVTRMVQPSEIGRFRPIPGRTTRTLFRGEFQPSDRSVGYRCSIQSVDALARSIVADVEILRGDTVIATIEDVAVEFIADKKQAPLGVSRLQLPYIPKRTLDLRDITPSLRQLDKPVHFLASATGAITAHAGEATERLEQYVGSIPPLPAAALGSGRFQKRFGVRYPLMAGAMAQGIASEQMVIAMSRAGFLCSFGAAGLTASRVSQAISQIRHAVGDHPFSVNLIHSPSEPLMEKQCVEAILSQGVSIIEASAFIRMTDNIIYYRAKGYSRQQDGSCAHRVIAKVSRLEVAKRFMEPAPKSAVERLLQAGLIDEYQAHMVQRNPIADAVTVEADSGGHTDSQALLCVLPAITSLRDEMEEHYAYSVPILVGAAGGIGTPQSVQAALNMGVDYVVTGSINQACVESGTSPEVKEMLAQADIADVAMAPAADMFELGAKVQVLKKGTLFASRAQKLQETYKRFDSWEAVPQATKDAIEQTIFTRTYAEVWQETVKFFQERDPSQITRVADDPKRQMALVFRWYLGMSSSWAIRGEAERGQDYQIWCGPAMGAFNRWVKGTPLEPPTARNVVTVSEWLLSEAAVLQRQALVRQLLVQARGKEAIS